jgi:hypothetical protein
MWSLLPLWWLSQLYVIDVLLTEEHVMTHTSKTTGKYLHSDIVTHDDVNGDKQDYFHYTWQAKPSDNRSPSPHNNKTDRNTL